MMNPQTQAMMITCTSVSVASFSFESAEQKQMLE